MLKKYKELKYNYLITMESNNEEEPNPEINVNTIVINNSDDLLRVFMERFTQQMSNQNLNPQFIDTVLQRSFEEDKVIEYQELGGHSKFLIQYTHSTF